MPKRHFFHSCAGSSKSEPEKSFAVKNTEINLFFSAMGAPGAISRIASHARPSVQSSCNERGLSELSALPGVMTDQLPPRRKPRNDLLRNYYGIGGKPAENAADITDIGIVMVCTLSVFDTCVTNRLPSCQTARISTPPNIKVNY